MHIAILTIVLRGCLGPMEAVREDLIDIRAVEIGGRGEGLVIHGNLEGFRLTLGIGHALAAQLIRVVAVEHGTAILAVDDKAVPVQARTVGQDNGGLPYIVAGADHGVAQLLVLPGTQDDGGGFIAAETDDHAAAGGSRAHGMSEKCLVGIMEHHRRISPI